MVGSSTAMAGKGSASALPAIVSPMSMSIESIYDPADAALVEALTGPLPRTEIGEGVGRFVRWYREYYNV